MTLFKVSKYLLNKYAQSSDDSLKKFKEKISPWLNGSIRILANTGSTLTPQITNDKNHLYNKYDQYSGNILTSFNNVKARLLSIQKNINNENFDIKRLDKELANIASILAANPQFKTNPFFLLKINTQYSFDDCVKAMRALVKKQIVSHSSSQA